MMHMDTKYTWEVAKQYGSTWYEWTQKRWHISPLLWGAMESILQRKNCRTRYCVLCIQTQTWATYWAVYLPCLDFPWYKVSTFINPKPSVLMFDEPSSMSDLLHPTWRLTSHINNISWARVLPWDWASNIHTQFQAVIKAIVWGWIWHDLRIVTHTSYSDLY